MATQQNNGQEQDLNHLRKVRREKLAELQANGQNPFEITKYDVTHHSQEVKDNFDELEGKHVVLAGRMMSKRVMGKASFCNVQDLQGNIQSYVARDSIGEEEYKAFKKMDIGDIVGVKGIHGTLEAPVKKKKGFFARFKKDKAPEVQSQPKQSGKSAKNTKAAAANTNMADKKNKKKK